LTPFGKWNAIYKRFNEWSRNEKLITLFNTLVVEPDLEGAFIDGSIVKAISIVAMLLMNKKMQ